jgi:hypothetical protein
MRERQQRFFEHRQLQMISNRRADFFGFDQIGPAQNGEMS